MFFSFNESLFHLDGGTMQGIDRRIAALEAKANAADDSLKLVFQDYDQSEAEALAKAGYPPDARRVLYMSSIDARL